MNDNLTEGGFNGRTLPSMISVVWLLTSGIMMLSLVGAGLLMLPQASSIPPTSNFFADALFTSVSAVCLVGLTIHNTAADYTPFGQAVILVLMQIGAIGILTFGLLAMSMIASPFGGIAFQSAPTRLDRSCSAMSQVRRAAAVVVTFTLAIELLGAALMYPMFLNSPAADGKWFEAAWQSLFHSVSAFCNAGFSTCKQNLMQGIEQNWPEPLRDNWQVIGVIAPLIVIGGLGLPVLGDIARYVSGLWRRSSAGSPGLTLHTKLALSTTCLLIVFGASGLLILEPARSGAQNAFGAPIAGKAERSENDWVALKPLGRSREALFQTVSARSAGFNTIDLGQLSNGSKLWLSGLMLAGASPSGTGGGMKTVAFALLALTAISVMRRRDTAVFDRKLSLDTLRSGTAMCLIYLALFGLITLLVSHFMDPRENFIDILFECASACGSSGMSTGLTTRLSDGAKFTLIAGMLLGRLVPMVLLLCVARRSEAQD